MQLNEIIDQLPIGKASNESAWVHNTVLIMKEFGYTVDEMRVMPVPTFITLLEELKKENERAERDSKRGRR